MLRVVDQDHVDLHGRQGTLTMCTFDQIRVTHLDSWHLHPIQSSPPLSTSWLAHKVQRLQSLISVLSLIHSLVHRQKLTGTLKYSCYFHSAHIVMRSQLVR